MHNITVCIAILLIALNVLFVVTSHCSAKECSPLYNKLHGNSAALSTRDFSIINEPYVRCSLQLTKHTITHSTGSALGVNGLFVLCNFLSVCTLCAFATCTVCSSAHKLSPRFLLLSRGQSWWVLTPKCLQCISIYYVFELPEELDGKADSSD